MTVTRRVYYKLVFVGFLALFSGLIWYGVQFETNKHILTVAFLNVGQGDAIFIESPDHHQLIIDGGPSSALISELSKVMPFYDRTIDAIVITNPDKDHYAGFIDLLQRYEVKQVFESGTKTETESYAELTKLICEKGINETLAKRGMVIHLGSGADLHILFPDRDVSGETTNNGSIIAKLVYGKTSVMLTGDAPNETEEYVLQLDASPGHEEIKSTVLKEGHHGSRTSSSETFISAVAPQYDVISAGKNNRYGHPHKETLDVLKKLGIPVLVTAEKGTIIMKSDGNEFKVEYK